MQAQKNALEDARRHEASLRDPAGYVFEMNGRVLRRLNEAAAKNWQRFCELPVAARLMNEGALIPTQIAVDIGVGQCKDLDGLTNDLNGLVLEHERISLISYACEWSQSMLRDVALLHLDLMECLIPLGWTLKDAAPANVQWRKGKPCLIDVASIEPYEGGPWRAYGQFCKTMLFPLFISAYAGGNSFQPILKGFGLRGVDAVSASKMLPGRAMFKPGVFVHLKLQAYLQRLADRRQRQTSSAMNLNGMASQVRAEAVLALIGGLRRALSALPLPQKTQWVGYQQTSTYSAKEQTAKHEQVSSWFEQHGRSGSLVLDVGCNTGVYSKLLAQQGAQVIAIDADMACVDSLYRQQPPGVLPLVLDMADPTGPAGWALGEQKAFTERAKPDWSLWLAVIHHLSVRDGIRLDAVVHQILKSAKFVIVEFVDRDDPMVQALLSERGDLRRDYSLAHFEMYVKKEGACVLESVQLTQHRRLYLIR